MASHDAMLSELTFRKFHASTVLPVKLLVHILEQINTPVIAYGQSEVVFLNSAARCLFPRNATHANQKIRSLLLRFCPGETPIVTQLELATAGTYEATIFHWQDAPDSPSCRIAVLRRERGRSTQGMLDTEKVRRLKAIVHEFRNSLTAAAEALSFVHEGHVGTLNEQQERFLGSVAEDLDGLRCGLVELTSLWITQAGVFRLMPQPVEIGQIIDQTTLWARPVAEKHGIRLDVKIQTPLPILIGDPNLLVHALRNVLTNALRHTPPTGSIQVRASAGAPHDADVHSPPQDNNAQTIIIEVQDSGPGIKAQDLERIFLAFERGDADAESTSKGGMGLGLTIARDITEMHGGTLGVMSEPGKGSRFVFQFPEHGNSPRSWMLRATHQAIEEVRPLRTPLAVALLKFDIDADARHTHPRTDLLSEIQQVAIQNLRPSDTVLAIEEKLLVLMRGSKRSAAYAVVDRVLHLLVERLRAARINAADCGLIFGVALYPEDGDRADDLLTHAETQVQQFQQDPH